MVGANIDNLLVLLVHDKVVIELDRNVSSSIAYYEKTLNIAKISLTEWAQTFWCTRKLQM